MNHMNHMNDLDDLGDLEKLDETPNPKPSPSWRPLQMALAVVGVVVAIVGLVAILLPSIISTPEMAVMRHATTTVWDFEDQQGLSRELVGQRSLEISDVRKEDGLLKAQIQVDIPVIPFVLHHKNLSTYDALKEFQASKYIDQPSGGKSRVETMPFVRINAQVSFEPSGIMGWRVRDDGGLPLQIKQAQQNYEARTSKTAKVIEKRDRAFNNPMSIKESISSGFMVVLLSVLMLVWTFLYFVLFSGGQNAWPILVSSVVVAVFNHWYIINLAFLNEALDPIGDSQLHPSHPAPASRLEK